MLHEAFYPARCCKPSFEYADEVTGHDLPAVEHELHDTTNINRSDTLWTESITNTVVEPESLSSAPNNPGTAAVCGPVTPQTNTAFPSAETRYSEPSCS